MNQRWTSDEPAMNQRWTSDEPVMNQWWTSFKFSVESSLKNGIFWGIVLQVDKWRWKCEIDREKTSSLQCHRNLMNQWWTSNEPAMNQQWTRWEKSLWKQVLLVQILLRSHWIWRKDVTRLQIAEGNYLNKEGEKLDEPAMNQRWTSDEPHIIGDEP